MRLTHDFDSQVSWMDAETKRRAKNKLGAIREHVGYPKELLDVSNVDKLYSGLEVDVADFYGNGLRLSVWGTTYYWGKLREKVDKEDWRKHSNPAIVNAFYSAIENSIQFPAGILQGTFFGKKRPAYLNYGGIGWVIGHEITHGFDDQGRQYDKDGNLLNWWGQKTQEVFILRAQCIIDQYGNYTADEVDLNLNGINTQGENIADNGGIKEAYRAYNQWVTRHGEEKTLPGLHLTPKQLFWTAAANTWCYKYRPKALEKAIRTGVHSPGEFRVLGPFSNSLAFAEDFQCPLGSRMNPKEKCSVW